VLPTNIQTVKTLFHNEQPTKDEVAVALVSYVPDKIGDMTSAMALVEDVSCVLFIKRKSFVMFVIAY